MPNVKLIFATPGAEDILIFTKNTRLNMTPSLFEEIKEWPHEKKMEELEYMSKTIPSSWEFVDLIFLIQDVTRAFTHQLVRSRHASFAQQTMRVVDMKDFGYTTGPTIENNAMAKAIYQSAMRMINHAYKQMVSHGSKPEDARGILPTNIHTNIVMKLNLRAFVELVRARSSGRVQGEYAEVLKQMVEKTKEAWPWVETFLSQKEMDAREQINIYLKEQMDHEMKTFGVPQNLTKAWDIMKMMDLLNH